MHCGCVNPATRTGPRGGSKYFSLKVAEDAFREWEMYRLGLESRIGRDGRVAVRLSHTQVLKALLAAPEHRDVVKEGEARRRAF